MQKYVLVMGKVAALLFLACIFNMHPKASAETLFGPNVRVENAVSPTYTQQDPTIAIDTNGNVFIVWYDKRNGNDDIYFAKSTDGGSSFGTNIRVDDDLSASGQYEPAIAADANLNVYVTWNDERSGLSLDIYFSKGIFIPPGDLDKDGDVDLVDFAMFAAHWLETSCGVCGGADLTGDGNVDFNDMILREFVANWLAGL